MSFETILIHRDLPIIDGFVQFAPNNEVDKNRVTAATAQAAITGSIITGLTGGSNSQRGIKCGRQEFLRLPGVTPDSRYTNDPIEDL